MHIWKLVVFNNKPSALAWDAMQFLHQLYGVCVLKNNFISKQIDLLFYNRKTNHRKGHIHSAKYHKCKCDSSIFIALVIVYEYSSRRRQPHTLNVRLVICNCYSSLDILCAHNAIHWIIKYTSFFFTTSTCCCMFDGNDEKFSK